MMESYQKHRIAKNTSKYFQFLVFLVSIGISAEGFGDTYVVPPSDVGAGGDYISDEGMERCVKLYNAMLALKHDINSTEVNHYSRTSVNAYNKKVHRHRAMQSNYNSECAGKSSSTADEVATELNDREGRNR